MNARGRILVVDDDALVRASLAELLGMDDLDVVCADGVETARGELSKRQFHVVLLDVYLAGSEGFDLLETIGSLDPAPSVVMMSGYGTIRAAVRAMKGGADDFLTKPVADEVVRETVQRLLAKRAVSGPVAGSNDSGGDVRQPLSVVGRDHRMRRALDMIDAIGGSTTTILITGESGTGKSLTARAIHDRSDRRAGPFVEVSCGAIAEGLLESELFGHLQGAFTGAVVDKIGRFLAADGGTIFLDEIDSASPALQVKLLRVLQEREFEPVGGANTIRVDVRVVLATNADLLEGVRQGTFRQDLYYRVNVINIELPPLRERPVDIPLLADHMLKKYCRRIGKRFVGFTEGAMGVLGRHEWPGNVRELENVVERAVLLGKGPYVAAEDFPDEMLAGPSGPTMTPAAMLEPAAADEAESLKHAMRRPERKIVEDALRANNWNRQQTAKMLQINRTTLYKKMKRYGLLETAPR